MKDGGCEVVDGASIRVGFEGVYIGLKIKQLGGLFAARLSLETRAALQLS